ncbi:LexA family protein [Dysgonomonas capnocytophagoides]|uniref:LexA family protein n=1 Tax=Dysgonomonas capnocytophagoides TaxID=45254 RepID=UPI00292000CF|nr:translesion error-prone DNA polymerase V autoproteolytic subunit [Dysgonomonas capnocytophagoides]
MNKTNLEIHQSDVNLELSLPFEDQVIKAGFRSPVEDYLETAINLNKELIKHPASTFYGRVKGDSMIETNVHDGDILVIDKSLEPRNEDMADCFIDSEFTIKYIKIEKDIIWLQPANDNYKPIKVTIDNDFIIWGIVTHFIQNKRTR